MQHYTRMWVLSEICIIDFNYRFVSCSFLLYREVILHSEAHFEIYKLNYRSRNVSMYDKKTGAFRIIPWCVHEVVLEIFLATSLHSSLVVNIVYSTVKIYMHRHLKMKPAFAFNKKMLLIINVIHLVLLQFCPSSFPLIHHLWTQNFFCFLDFFSTWLFVEKFWKLQD